MSPWRRASDARWSACESFGLPAADAAAAWARLFAVCCCSALLIWGRLAASWFSCEAAAWLSPLESACPALAVAALACSCWPAADAACSFLARFGSWSERMSLWAWLKAATADCGSGAFLTACWAFFRSWTSFCCWGSEPLGLFSACFTSWPICAEDWSWAACVARWTRRLWSAGLGARASRRRAPPAASASAAERTGQPGSLTAAASASAPASARCRQTRKPSAAANSTAVESRSRPPSRTSARRATCSREGQARTQPPEATTSPSRAQPASSGSTGSIG